VAGPAEEAQRRAAATGIRSSDGAEEVLVSTSCSRHRAQCDLRVATHYKATGDCSISTILGGS